MLQATAIIDAIIERPEMHQQLVSEITHQIPGIGAIFHEAFYTAAELDAGRHRHAKIPITKHPAPNVTTSN
jgi:hypothetical protein